MCYPLVLIDEIMGYICPECGEGERSWRLTLLGNRDELPLMEQMNVLRNLRYILLSESHYKAHTHRMARYFVGCIILRQEVTC